MGIARHLIPRLAHLLVALAAGTTVAAIPPVEGYLVRNWTTTDGLPENTVRAIAQARNGYLWIGTAGGIARFDGIRFVSFTSANTPGLLSDAVWDVCEDGKGNIWVATARGLARYDQTRFTFIDSVENRPLGVVRRLAVDKTGAVWGLAGAELWRWEAGQVKPLKVGNADASIRILDLADAPGADLWLATENGLWQIQGDRFIHVNPTVRPDRLSVDPQGRVYMLQYPDRLSVWSNHLVTPLPPLEAGPFQSLEAVPSGDLWLGAQIQNRAFRLRGGSAAVVGEEQGLQGNRPICFLEDREGNLWMGLNRGGLFRLREARVHVAGRREGLPTLFVNGVCEDRDASLVVSLFGGGLFRWNGTAFGRLEVGGNSNLFTSTTAVIPARPGGFWVGTLNGRLARIEEGQVRERVGGSGGTRVLLQASDGSLWRGTRTQGVEHFADAGIRRFDVTNGLSFGGVLALAEDARGMWVGTEHGLNHIEGDRVTRYFAADGLGNEYINSLCVDSRGTLWVGTEGGGLAVRTPKGFVQITERHGLPHRNVEQILEDNYQNLWIGTRAGLMRIALTDLDALLDGRAATVHGTRLGQEEGVPRPQFGTGYQPSSLKSRDGRLWFCGDSGLVMIDPGTVGEHAPAPAVQIEEVTVDGLSTTVTPEFPTPFRVPADGERLDIRYTGISLSAPEQVRFRYRLVGWDSDWVEAFDQRVARYSRVKPGRYEFRVVAANHDGVWNETGASFPLVFEPTVWETAWFRGLVLAVLLGAGPSFFFWRIRLANRRRAAQEAFSRKLINSQEQERGRIAAELHDSLGQNLLVIKNRASLALTQQAHPDKMAAQLAEVSTMASASIREVREIAQNLRPFQLDELGLTRAIAATARKVGDASGIEFTLSLENIDHHLPPEYEISLYRILQECLNNIVKHSGATRAEIQGTCANGEIRLVVRDFGCGLDPAAGGVSNGGAGIGHITERARTMGGKAVFHSRPGEGVSVEVRVPVGNA